MFSSYGFDYDMGFGADSLFGSTPALFDYNSNSTSVSSSFCFPSTTDSTLNIGEYEESGFQRSETRTSATGFPNDFFETSQNNLFDDDFSCPASVFKKDPNENVSEDSGFSDSGALIINEDINDDASSDSCIKDEVDETSLDEMKQEDIIEVPEIEICNVVSRSVTHCHINLRHLCQKGMNVWDKKCQGRVELRLKRPHVTASIWKSGVFLCKGSRSNEQAYIAARKVARYIQKLGYPNMKFSSFEIVNYFGVWRLPFGVNLPKLYQKCIYDSSLKSHLECIDYSPEFHPGLHYKMKSPVASMKIFSTGNVTITARTVSIMERAAAIVYPILEEFRREISQEHELDEDDFAFEDDDYKRKKPRTSKSKFPKRK